MHFVKGTLLCAVIVVLSGCTQSDPGPLQGKWRMAGPIPASIEFRSGETETMGVIEKVSYEVNGNDVIVHTEDGMAKGLALHYRLVDASTAQSPMGKLRRVQ